VAKSLREIVLETGTTGHQFTFKIAADFDISSF
jgi:hypothetical protein